MTARIRVAPVLLLGVFLASGQNNNAARQELITKLDRLADSQLADRARAISQIQTRAEAERRKEQIRRRILDLIGGLPGRHSPVAVKQFGTLSADGFRVEKLAYESLPGFWVTANLYLPAGGSGPFPAVLLSPGHEATGKLSQYSFGANFARNGVIALAIDPLGQGERLQYFDPERKASLIGGSTGEHGEANVPALLIGENVARYMINDAMRGIDYLAGRNDVDAGRIGALGCSGGGTVTAYLAALDDRVRVAGVACYITSFHELLPSPTGAQEAEQSIPRFIGDGLDFGDWIELFAPKPYAVISTTEDMFPFEGARQTVAEAKRIYGLYGAEDQLQWITGPGGHGNLGPISPAILGFFLHHLKGAPAGDAPFTPMRGRAEDLRCTPTGQVATSLSPETVASLVRQEAVDQIPAPVPPRSRAELDRLRARVKQAIRELAGVEAVPSSNPVTVRTISTEESEGSRSEHILLSSGGAELPGTLTVPAGSGKKRAILMLGGSGGDVAEVARSGRIVMALEPRPAPPGSEGLKSPYLGSFNLLGLSAALAGKTIVGLRVDDVVRAIGWLRSRADVDASAIALYGKGAFGVVALHAAALDDRIRQVMIEDTLTSYRMVLDEPLHRDIPEVLIPGVLRQYDLGDLVLAISPRRISVLNPQDASGAALSEEQFRKTLAYVFQSEENLGTAQRVRVQVRSPGDPLPLN